MREMCGLSLPQAVFCSLMLFCSMRQCAPCWPHTVPSPPLWLHSAVLKLLYGSKCGFSTQPNYNTVKKNNNLIHSVLSSFQAVSPFAGRVRVTQWSFAFTEKKLEAPAGYECTLSWSPTEKLGPFLYVMGFIPVSVPRMFSAIQEVRC